MTLLKGTPTCKFAKALELLGFDIYYDVREARVMVEQDGVIEPANDRFMAHIRYRIAEAFTHMAGDKEVALFFGKDKFYDLRDAHTYTNEKDRFRDWLEALPVIEVTKEDAEDYKLKIDWMLADGLGAGEDLYDRHCSRIITLGAVWRTFNPSCKLDEVPVLKGKQGIGKDSILTSLVPWEGLYTTSFSFKLPLKQRIEVTRGRVFVIASEMGGVTTTADLEDLKNYVTATHDDMRMAYRRDSDLMLRRFVFCGTTNLSRPLPHDVTGNRRWMVSECDESQVGAIEPWIEDQRERLWGEAVALYRMGVKPSVPRWMKDVQSGRNEELERIDEQFENAYESAIDSGDLKMEVLTLSDIAFFMKISDTCESFRRERKEVQHRLRDQLERQGWKSRRGRHPGTNKVSRLWYPPITEAEAEGVKKPVDEDIPF